MLVVKSLIFTTLVESARLAKHVYEAKLATESGPCPSWVGHHHETGQCEDWHAGACYKASAKDDSVNGVVSISTQCLKTAAFDAYRCPSSAPIKCTYGATPAPDPTPSPSGLDECPAELAWGSGTDKIDPNGQCNSGHAGACYSEALVGQNGGKITTQCLPAGHLEAWYKCPPEASKKCEFAKKHFSLAEEEEEVALPACPDQWIGNEKETGLCAKSHKGACYDPTHDKVNGVVKITTQCLPSDWHMSGSYRCPSNAPQKCENKGTFEIDIAPPPGQTLDSRFQEWCPGGTGSVSVWKGLCNKRQVGACYGSGTTQCLEPGMEHHRCPKDFTKCQFSSLHSFSLAEVEAALPACPHQWIGNEKETGLCAKSHQGACYDPAHGTANGITTQCLPSAWHMSGSYKCPSNAPKKCENKGTFEIDIAPPAGETLDPNFPDWCPSGTGSVAVWNGLCRSGQVGACFGNGITQCLEPGMAHHRCPKDFTKCQFSKKHDFSLAEVNEMEGVFKEEGTDEGNCLCYYGGRTHYCNHGGNGMCVCGMNSWDWKRQSDYSKCGHHR